MATRRLHFLIRPVEFQTIINYIINHLGLYAVLADGTKDACTKLLDLPLTLDFLNHLPFCIFYLSRTPVHDKTPVSKVSFAEEGWIQVIVSREKNDMLGTGEISIKTDWYKNDKKLENTEGLKFFNQVQSALKKHLKFAAYDYDVESGKTWPCKIGYTEKTKAFEEQGGLLVRFGDVGKFNTRITINKKFIRIDPTFQHKLAQKNKNCN